MTQKAIRVAGQPKWFIPYFAALALILVAAVSLHWKQFAHSAPSTSLIADHDFTNGEAPAVLTGAWVKSGDGLALPAGASGTMLMPVERGTSRYLSGTFWVYAPEHVDVDISCSPDTSSFRRLSTRGFRNEPLDLSGCGNNSFVLRIEARSSRSLPELALVVDKIQFFGSADRPGALPRLPLLVAVLLTFAIAALLAVRRLIPLAAALPIAAASILPGVLSSSSEPKTVLLSLLPLAVLATIALFGRSWLVVEAAAGSAIFTAAVFLRWRELEQALLTKLFPDADAAVGIAEAMKHPFDTSVREPLWIWCIKLLQWMGVDPTLRARLFSFAASLLLLVVVYIFVRRYFVNAALAIIVLASFAFHPYFVEASAFGLRTELQTAALVAIAWFSLAPMDERRRVIGYTASVVIGLLTYLGAMMPAVALLVYAKWKHRMRWASVAIVVAVMMVAFAPVAAYNWIQFKDPFYSTNTFVAVWYRNYEFMHVKQGTCDGCPPREAWLQNAYQGKEITLNEYIFGMHDLPEVTRSVLRGYAEVFALRSGLWQTITGQRHVIAYFLYWGGVILLLFSKQRDLLLPPVVALNLAAFLVPLGIDPRLVMFAAPFHLTAIAFAMVRPFALLAARPLTSGGPSTSKSIRDWPEMMRRLRILLSEAALDYFRRKRTRM